MHKFQTKELYLIIVLASSLIACSEKNSGATNNSKPALSKLEIKMDTDSKASSQNLIRLQESPAFPQDNKAQIYAMKEDSIAKKVKSNDKPIRLQEIKTKQ